MAEMDGRIRANISIGARVRIVMKADQATGRQTEGVVARILTGSSRHPHGIKVMLEDGRVGRVAVIEPEGGGALGADA